MRAACRDRSRAASAEGTRCSVIRSRTSRLSEGVRSHCSGENGEGADPQKGEEETPADTEKNAHDDTLGKPLLQGHVAAGLPDVPIEARLPHISSSIEADPSEHRVEIMSPQSADDCARPVVPAFETAWAQASTPCVARGVAFRLEAVLNRSMMASAAEFRRGSRRT